MQKNRLSLGNSCAIISTCIFFVLFIDTYINIFATSSLYDILLLSCVGFFLLAVLLSPRKDQNVYLKAIILILIFNLIYYFGFYPTLSFVGKYSLLFMSFFPILLAIYYIKVPYIFRKRVMCFAWILIIITGVTTIVGLAANPYVTKMMANPTYVTNELLSKNIGGYSFIYMLVCMVPLVIYKIKQANKKPVYIALFILLLYTIYCSQYAIALICATLLSAKYLFISKRKKSIAIIVCVIAILLAIVFAGSITTWIKSMAQSLPRNMSILSNRLISLSEFFSGNDTMGDTNFRLGLYLDSFLAFVLSAGLGNMLVDSGHTVWGHSSILDTLGKTGFLGGLLLFVLVKYSVKKTYYQIHDHIFSYYFKGSIIGLLIISFVDPTIGFPAITVSAFLFPILMYDKEII